MGRIRILPEALAGKIAAGEVIERPASALKELLENSIDAHATSIKIYIKGYGISEIKVVDDGEGIPSEDVILALQRHATSKIEKEEDLFKINTLGFRGEALYSIAQVSKLRIITQHKYENIGTEIFVCQGDIIERKPANANGTTIQIEDLFFNTPVRKKFLKSPFTERAHILETVQNYALAYPETSFYLNIDGEEVLNFPRADSIKERIAQVFGVEFLEKLEFKSISDNRYRIELFWGNTQLVRRNRTKQLIFVNRRPVRDSLVSSSLYKAFKVKEFHPQFLFFLTMPSDEVDFNVHPTKKEVRFRDTARLSELIFNIAEPEKISIIAERPVEWAVSENSNLIEQINFFQLNSFEAKEEFVDFLSLGDAIVAIRQSEGILFIDYHAAHERVNFEKILKALPESSMNLVFPQIIELNPTDYELIVANLNVLKELMIEAENFGKNSIIIRNIPEILKNVDLEGIIESIASVLKEELVKPDFTDIKRKIAETIACHKSMRSNTKITASELKALLRELEQTSDPEHCPHGRPIKKFISLEDIKKWFMRK